MLQKRHSVAVSWLTNILLVGFVLILVLLPLHAFLSTWLGTIFGPLLAWKSWKEILLLALVPSVLIYCALRPKIARQLRSRPINQLIVLYGVLHVGLVFTSAASIEATIAALLMNLRFLAMFASAQLLVVSGHPYIECIKTVVPWWLLWAMSGLAVFAILQVTVLPADFLVGFGYDKDSTIAPYILVDQNEAVRRAFATMRGPNTLGAYLLLPLAVALWYVLRRRGGWLAPVSLILGLIALFATGSRSSWIGFSIMATVLTCMFAGQDRLLRWLRWSTVPVLIFLGLFIWASANVPAVRLAVFHSSPGDPSLIEGSSEQHWEAAQAGIKNVIEHPFGQGPGTAGPASFYNPEQSSISENYFIQIAEEVGVLGLLLFIIINILLAHRLYLQRDKLMPRILFASLAGLTIINIFLHGWADDPTAMTWWAIAGLFYKE